MSEKRNLAIEEREYAYIAIDFDNCVVSDLYPEIGVSLNAEKILKKLVAKGHKLILWTIRSGEPLQKAVQWFKDNGIELFAVNENPDFEHDDYSRKIYYDLCIDDRNIGVPVAALFDSPRNRILRVVDWDRMLPELKNLNLL